MSESVYPGGIKPWTDKNNHTDDVKAEDINDLYAEVIAIETDAIAHKSSTTQMKGFKFDYKKAFIQNVIMVDILAGWANDAYASAVGTYGVDNINYKVSGQGAKCTTSSNNGGIHCEQLINFTKTPDEQISDNNDYMYYVFKIDDTSLSNLPTNGIRLVFSSNTYPTITSIFYIDILKANIINGENHIKVKKSAFSDVGSPDWSTIKFFSTMVNGVPSGAVTFTNMYFAVIRKDPLEDKANEYQEILNGVRTRIYNIQSGEYRVFSEYGIIKWKQFKNTSSGAPTQDPTCLIGTKTYSDFTITLTEKMGNVGYSSATTIWEIDSNNKIIAHPYNGNLYLEYVQNGVLYNASPAKAFIFSEGDIVTFTLEKTGSTVIYTAMKNYNDNTKIVLKEDLPFSATTLGYVGIGSVSGLTNQSELLHSSITTTQHSNTSNVAEVAKSLEIEFKAGAFTINDLNFGALGIDTANSRLYLRYNASTVKYATLT